MLIYKDFVNGDELCSDSYPSKLLFNDVIMEVDGANIKEDGGIDDALIGGNASADGADADAGADDAAVTGINVVMNAKLVGTAFSKKDLKTYMMPWFKKAKKWIEENKSKERADIFMKEVPGIFKELTAKVKDIDFYLGENMDPEGSLVFGFYREDGITPYFWYFKDALEEEKF